MRNAAPLAVAGALTLLAIGLLLHFLESPTGSPSVESGVQAEIAAERTVAGTLEPIEERERERELDTNASTPSPAASLEDRGHFVRLRARCTDEHGRSLAGARCIDAATGAARATSAVDGHLELQIPVAAEGETSVAVVFVMERRTPYHADRRLSTGETWELGDIALPLGGRLRGRVVDEQARGVEKARVTTTRSTFLQWAETSEPDSIHAESAHDGSFELDGVPPGMTRVSARTARHAAVEAPHMEVAAGGDVAGIELTLGPQIEKEELRLVFRVLDPDGKAVPRARIEYHALHSPGEGRGRRTADERGTVAFVTTARDVFYVRATDPEQRFSPAYALGVTGGAKEVELRLSHTTQVTLLVVDTDDVPVEQFAWRILDTRQYHEHGSSALTEDKRGVLRDSFAEFTSTGEFEPEEHSARPGGTATLHAPDLDFIVQVSAPGYALAQEGAFRRGSVPDPVRVVLERLPALRGTVYFAGTPVAQARVRLHNAREADQTLLVEGFPSRSYPEAVSQVLTDDDGRFEITLRDPGNYVLHAGHPARGEAELGPLAIAPRTGADGLVLELAAFGSIAGVLRVPRGELASDFVIGASGGEGSPRAVRPSRDGSFRLDGLMPGNWLLLRLSDIPLPDLPRGWERRKGAELSQPAPHTCVVRSGETTHVEIDLTNKAVLRCIQELPAPYSSAMWNVSLTPIGATFSRGSSQNSALPRQVNLVVDAPGEYLFRATATVTSGASGQFAFSVEEPLRLVAGENDWTWPSRTGSVVLTNRRPTPIDVRLRCRHAAGGQSWVRLVLAADSDRELTGLRDGDWMIIDQENGVDREAGGVGIAPGGPARLTWNR